MPKAIRVILSADEGFFSVLRQLQDDTLGIDQSRDLFCHPESAKTTRDLSIDVRLTQVTRKDAGIASGSGRSESFAISCTSAIENLA